MIIFFPETFLYVLIVGALLMAGASVVILLYLLIKDKRSNNVW